LKSLWLSDKKQSQKMASYLTAGAKKLRKAREWATPTLKESAFLEKGVLTPEEFVKAGDELVYKCPTWSWESGEPKKRKPYLPDDKQFLITRNVPCQTRVAALENSVVTEMNPSIVDDNKDEGDWLMSTIVSPEEHQRRMDEALEEEFDILDEEGEVVKAMKETNLGTDALSSNDNHNDDNDEYADMAEFEDDNIMEDDAAVTTGNLTMSGETNGDNIMKVRTYDLSMTYDNYYRTPRVWMMGYDSTDSSQPLTGEQIMEDVMSDYANRTVTIDPHPHIKGVHASIHPCQHGAVMKTIVKNLSKASSDGNGEIKSPSVEMYIFIFLKFVSSIIPTITYDFTMDVTASTKT
jgi:ubiquitin-like-conjugating enzyme ATG3